jgi:hypothetical protein
MKQLYLILTIILFSIGCKGPLSAPKASETKSVLHIVIVNEVLQAGEYTYLNVSEKRKKIWLAVPSIQIAKGERISYTGGFEMKDFFSKELKRTFSEVLLLESINTEQIPGKKDGMIISSHGIGVKTEKINVSIEPGEGCISIAKILEAKDGYSGKTIRVKGKITKFNSAILGKNWIHIQDGTQFKGVFDLAITTDSQLVVGDTATFEGTITLKKDFGYGYFYDVIMEDGKLIK